MTVLCCMMPSTIALPIRQKNKDADGLIAVTADTDLGYSNYFTGIHGNYLRGSITSAGFDADALPAPQDDATPTSAKTAGSKAWKDIWGSGQGIGNLKEATTVSGLIERFAGEYRDAIDQLNQQTRVANTTSVN